jgi:hypothetical protein
LTKTLLLQLLLKVDRMKLCTRSYRVISFDEFSSSTIHFLFMHHKIFTWSCRSRLMEETNQKWRFWSKLRFLNVYRTSPEGLRDKSRKPYWNLVKGVDISGVQNWRVRFTKPDTPVLTGQGSMEELWKKLEKLREIWKILT